jgi:nucleotide-binding universal stress UspA family protein
MKTILVPSEQHEALTSMLQTAVLLARRFDSYIEGFALFPALLELYALNSEISLPIEVKEHDAEMAKQARATFERFMREHGVPSSPQTKQSLAFGWLDEAPDGDAFVGSYGRVFDVVVMGRSQANTVGLRDKAIESGLFDSGRPILIAAPTPPAQIGTNVLVAWNCSTEQARATAFAMPLLRRAERITVLHVEGGAAVPGPSAAQATQYLQRNGVKAVPMTVGLEGRTTGEAILAVARSLDCDLLIKGAYTQSRLRQMIFGGATRHILAHATLPVLMAN